MASIQVQGRPEGEGPSQYRRAEVERRRRPYKWREGQREEVRDNTRGRRWRDVGSHTSRGEARGRRPESIQEGGGGGA